MRKVRVNRKSGLDWFHVYIDDIPGEFHLLDNFVVHCHPGDRRELGSDGSYSSGPCDVHKGGYKESMDRIVKYIRKEY